MKQPTLSVLVSVHENPHVAAAALRFLRPVCDEIVVAVDARLEVSQLRELGDISDTLKRFEFSGANRFRPWLKEQGRGEWLLLLDGDELASTALIDALPQLLLRRDIAAYRLPCWWLYQNSKTRLSNKSWAEDTHLRLVRNNDQTWFPGTKHTGAMSDGPIRFVDAPFIHLDLLLKSESQRREKVARYNNENVGYYHDGRPLNETFYLPEDDRDVEIAPIPECDAKRVDEVLATPASNDRFEKPIELYPVGEVEKWWAANPQNVIDYRAKITAVSAPRNVLAGGLASFDLEIENLGLSIWPQASAARPEPLIHLSYHCQSPDGAVTRWDGARTPLGGRVFPGEKLRVNALVDVPLLSGGVRLVFDLVHENVRWFGTELEIDLSVDESLIDFLAMIDKAAVMPVEHIIGLRRKLRGSDALAAAVKRSQAGSVRASLGPWAMVDATIDHVLERIGRTKAQRVLEVGSGASTVAFAAKLAASGGQILSIDESEDFAERTRRNLAAARLHNVARVFNALLAPTQSGGLTTLCYDFSAIRDEIRAFAPELIVIDGPSSNLGGSRFAVALLLSNIVQRTTPFVMDDAFRDAELDIARRWKKESALRIDGIVPVGRGLLIGSLAIV